MLVGRLKDRVDAFRCGCILIVDDGKGMATINEPTTFLAGWEDPGSLSNNFPMQQLERTMEDAFAKGSHAGRPRFAKNSANSSRESLRTWFCAECSARKPKRKLRIMLRKEFATKPIRT